MKEEKMKTAEFICRNPDCRRPVRFDFASAADGRAVPCDACGTEQRFDPALSGKLRLLRDLLASLRAAAPILGDGRLVMESERGNLEIPLSLLFARMTTDFTLDFGENRLGLRVAVNPLSGGRDGGGGGAPK